MASAVVGWLKTSEGVKTGIFRTSYHAVDWYQIYNHGALSPELSRFRGATYDAKNAISLAQLPQRVIEAVGSVFKFLGNPRWGNGHQVVMKSLEVISPANDALEFIHARALPISPTVLKPLGIMSVAATAVLSLNDVVEHALQIPDAPTSQAVCSELFKIAAAVSYLALAAIILVSTFYAPIAYASFWILVSSTSGLACTIIGEFV